MTQGLGMGEWWEPHWRGMPEFVQEDLGPWRTVEVCLKNETNLKEFLRVSGSKLYHGKWMWWPEQGYNRWRDRPWGGEPICPRYPIYIISKGRWESRQTARYLDMMNVPYHIVVEPQEYGQYASVIDPKKILTLPFSNLGRGSIPARNWVWAHSIRAGSKKHWILDDNIRGIYRLNRNEIRIITTGAPFRAAEDFTNRYENIGLSGFQYELLVMRRDKCTPFRLNTRIYSCILIDNSLPFRWRGKYNEDTDLSLKTLKLGLCTVIFNAFLCKKMGTMRMSGGNTDELYQQNDKFDGRLAMAKSLQKQHPDCVTITRKWGRFQHQVDYSRFKYNRLIMKPGLNIPDGINEYGMELMDNWSPK